MAVEDLTGDTSSDEGDEDYEPEPAAAPRATPARRPLPAIRAPPPPPPPPPLTAEEHAMRVALDAANRRRRNYERASGIVPGSPQVRRGGWSNGGFGPVSRDGPFL